MSESKPLMKIIKRCYACGNMVNEKHDMDLCLERESNDFSKDESVYKICSVKGCNEVAIVDYNGHGDWVCKSCYDSLSRIFDEEYR